MIKRIVTILLCFCLLPMTVLAEEVETSAGWHLVLNGKHLASGEELYIENDRAMVSGRRFAQAVGLSCVYEGGVLNIQNGGLIFTDASDLAKLNGVDTKLDVVASERDGDLFVPIRFFAESLGFQVHFTQEMTEDGTQVHASIISISPLELPFSVMVPEDCAQQAQLLQIAASVTNATTTVIAGPKDAYLEWAGVKLSAGEKTLIYDDGRLHMAKPAGLFCDLTPYLKEITPKTLALIESDEAIRQKVTDETGAIIAFPVQFGDKLEWYYVPATLEKVEMAVAYLYIYNEIVSTLSVQ